MIQKRRNKKSLAELSTRFIDLGANSPDFFNISFMPDQFTAGKNLFKFKPNTSRFSPSDPIQIEIIDFNGNPVYHEVLNYKEDDGSLVVAVYVYNNTSSGNCTITFIGTTIVDEQFKLLPQNERASNNFKYTHKLYINSRKQNESEIIFINDPVVSVCERVFSVVEEKFLITKTGVFSSFGSYVYTNNSPKFISTDTPFKEYFQNGTIRFKTLSDDHYPTVSFNTSSFEYVSDIVNVRTPFEMELKSPVKINGTLDQTQLLKTIANQPYEVTFSYTPSSRVITQNVKTYAQLDLSNIQPATGDVTRVKVFYKTTFKPESEYEQIYDAEIGSKNILVDISSSMVEYAIGKFEGSEDIINPLYPAVPSILNATSYWTASTNDLYATTSIGSDDFPLFGSLTPSADRELSGSSEILVSQTNVLNIPYFKDSEYRVVFDYYMDTDSLESRGPKIDVYVTGSSFVNDSQFGKFVESVPTGSQAKKFGLDYSCILPTNADGTGRLVFVIRRGCVISNIRVVENVDFGFTPNRTRLYIPIKSDHRHEYLDFKIQFFNNTLLGANKQVEIYDKFFVGGNAYIYGSDNLITGSTFVSPFTSSGIHIYGNKTSISSGSVIKSYGYDGIDEAIDSLDPFIPSKFGWGLTTHDPFHSGTTTGKSVEMINECGALLEFRSSPPSFKLYAVGENSSVLIGTSGSSGEIGNGGAAEGCSSGTCGESYIKWDGCRIIIRGVYDVVGNQLDGGAGAGGSSGTSGISGNAGTSGIDGTSGTSGIDGTSGTSGIDGTSGTSGIDGTSGTSGIDGTSGTSGIDGTSGTSGIDGTSGTSGIDGTSGTSGIDGTSGTSGIDGTSGTSGIDGTSGTSGIDGTSGTSGIDGTSGTSGIDGTSGTSGIDGTSGSSGSSGSSGLTGTSGSTGSSGTSGSSGSTGTSGSSGSSGSSGTSGSSGSSGTSGSSGSSGTSGSSGSTGTSGSSGSSGTSGSSGSSGTSGSSGSSGTSGSSGLTGTSGSSGQTAELSCCDCVGLMVEVASWMQIGRPPTVNPGQFSLLRDCGLVKWPGDPPG